MELYLYSLMYLHSIDMDHCVLLRAPSPKKFCQMIERPIISERTVVLDWNRP